MTRRTSHNSYRSIHLWLWPLLLLLTGTVLIRILDLDRAVSGFFFFPDPWCAWWGEGDKIMLFLRRWGEFAAHLVGLAGIAMLIASWIKPDWRRWRRTGTYILLSFVLGLLVINTLLKGNFGRPRPRAIQEFGFQEPFLPVLVPGESGEGSSFPSGHAAAGFYLVYMYLGLRDRRPRTARCFAWGGLIVGSLLGFVRITQGGHFLSDVLWAFGAVYFIGYLTYRFWAALDSRETKSGKPD